jgi:hypothetical protein
MGSTATLLEDFDLHYDDPSASTRVQPSPTLRKGKDVWWNVPHSAESNLGTSDGGRLLCGMPRFSRIVSSDKALVGEWIPSGLMARRHVQNAAGSLLDALIWIKSATCVSDTRIGEMVGVTRQAISAWQRRTAQINDTNRRRLLATRDILRRAAARVGEGEPLKMWLDTPVTDDGRTPADLIENGQFDKARYYAVASVKSPEIASLPTWASPDVARHTRRAPKARMATPVEEDEIAAEIGRYLDADES